MLHATIYRKQAKTQHNPVEDQWQPEEYIEHLDGHRDAILELLAFINTQKTAPN